MEDAFHELELVVSGYACSAPNSSNGRQDLQLCGLFVPAAAAAAAARSG